jgi:predicted transcriptional regulator
MRDEGKDQPDIEEQVERGLRDAAKGRTMTQEDLKRLLR